MAELLRQRGLDAAHIRELGMASEPDEAILTKAAQDCRVVVSRDADFSALLAQDTLVWPSFVHLRVAGLHDPARQVELLLEVFVQTANELEQGAIVSIQHGRFRVRTLPIRSR